MNDRGGDEIEPRRALQCLASRIAVARAQRLVDDPLVTLPTGVLPLDCPAGFEVDDLIALGGGALDVDLLGSAHESLLDGAHRHRAGVHYTPRDVAEAVVHRLVERLSPTSGARPLVCDPACGGGVFLVAAARELEARGWDRTAIVEDLLWGVDIDPLAVEVSVTTLTLWAAETSSPPSRTHIVVADSLHSGLRAWPDAPTEGFDVVVGNPPFQSQLARSTAREGAAAGKLRDRFGSAAYRYADTAALFMLEACSWTREGGQVALILPQSFLVTGDVAEVRRRVLHLGSLDEIWLAGESVFGAAVRVCAPFVTIGAPWGAVRRSTGRAFVDKGSVEVDRDELAMAGTWALLTADLGGVPGVTFAPLAPTLASISTASAGFRDQFYGIAPFVREAGDTERDRLLARAEGARPSERIGLDDRPAGMIGDHLVAKLVTCGVIEPGRDLWGRRGTRLAGTRFSAPVVDLDALAAADPTLMAWTLERLVPKVVVATQTRVLEAIVDADGSCFPSVPTIAVVAAPDLLWRLAAVVMAPAITAWALHRHAGAALSADAIKVSASQLLAAPLPGDEAAWSRGTVRLERAAGASDEAEWRSAMHDFGTHMGDAYGSSPAVLEWWFDRLPRWRRGDG